MKNFTKTDLVITLQLMFGLLFLVYAIIPGKHNQLYHLLYAIGFIVLAATTYYRAKLRDKN
jgi:hypothetical protein